MKCARPQKQELINGKLLTKNQSKKFFLMRKRREVLVKKNYEKKLSSCQKKQQYCAYFLLFWNLLRPCMHIFHIANITKHYWIIYQIIKFFLNLT